MLYNSPTPKETAWRFFTYLELWDIEIDLNILVTLKENFLYFRTLICKLPRPTTAK